MRKLIKRFTAILLVAITVISTFSLTVSADSNNIIATYIALAKDGAVTDDALNTETLTQSQLRFLGVYASNFFVPFSTELGEAAGDETDEQMEQLAEALKNGLNFSDEYAQVFAENLMGLSRGSVETLEFRVTRVGEDDRYVQLSHHPVANTYLNFLLTMTGNTKSLKYHMSENSSLNTEWDDMYRGVWGYGSGENFTPVFDCYLHSEAGVTASQLAFLKCLESVPVNEGYGFNILDLVKGEIGDGDDIADISSKSASLDLTIFGSEMEVDCFGNIIIHGLQHQVIAVPGCVNPFVWQPVTSDGADSGRAGDVYQGINVQSMAALDNGPDGGNSLFTQISVSDGNSSGGSGETGGQSGTVRNILMFSQNSNMYKKLKAAQDFYTAYSNVGLATYNVSGRECGRIESLEEILDAFAYILNYADGVGGNSGEWEVLLQTTTSGGDAPGVYARSKLGNVAQLDSSILEQDATNWSDQAKRDKLEDCMDIVLPGVDINQEYITNYYPGTSREDFLSCVDRAQNTAIDLLMGDGNSSQETDNTGATNVILKNFVPKVNLTLPSTLRRYRGSDEVALDLDLKPGSGGNILDVVLKAFEQYKQIDNIESQAKQEQISKKFEDIYALYLESIDKYIMDSIYKKVKNDTATDFEKNAGPMP